MPSTSNNTKCLWSVLLAITVTACFSILFVYIRSKGGHADSKGHLKEFAVQEPLSEETCIPVCDTKECVSYANQLLRSMKPSADPCESFDTFVCGAYDERVARDELRRVQFDAENNAINVLNDIFRNIQADPESASGKLKTVYDSCMNYGSTEKHALSTAQNFLRDIGIPDWPNLAPDFEFQDTDIPTILGKMKARGEVLFLMFMVPPRGEPSDDDLPLDETYTLTIRIDPRYFNHLLDFSKKPTIVHILKYFDLDTESVEDIWSDYSNVRNTILKLKDENKRDISDCGKDRKEYGQESGYYFDPNSFNDHPWFKYIYADDPEHENFTCFDHKNDSTYMCKFVEAFFDSSDLKDQINKDHVIFGKEDEHFLTYVIPVLMNFTDRAVANFLALNFYFSHLEELNFYFQLTETTYVPFKRCDAWKKETKVGRTDRWRICTEWLINNMQFATQYEFVKNYLTYEEHKKINEFFKESKSELAKAISYQDWLSEDEKDIINMEYMFLSLDHLFEYQTDPEKYLHSMNEYYKTFQPTKENFFHNALELRRTLSDIYFLLSPIDKYLIRLTFEVNAYYSGSRVIEYHLGPFISPFYTLGLPRVLNLLQFARYGAHELGHHLHDYMGFRAGNATLLRKNESEQCLINQFSKFKFEFIDENLKGEQYLSENFADNIMIFFVDKLIEKYVSAHEEILLPGIKNSFKEIAYIIVNQLVCEKPSSKFEAWLKKIDNHAPDRLRIIGPMQNSRGFSETFNCSVGRYMNPSRKCNVLDI